MTETNQDLELSLLGRELDSLVFPLPDTATADIEMMYNRAKLQLASLKEDFSALESLSAEADRESERLHQELEDKQRLVASLVEENKDQLVIEDLLAGLKGRRKIKIPRGRSTSYTTIDMSRSRDELKAEIETLKTRLADLPDETSREDERRLMLKKIEYIKDLVEKVIRNEPFPEFDTVESQPAVVQDPSNAEEEDVRHASDDDGRDHESINGSEMEPSGDLENEEANAEGQGEQGEDQGEADGDEMDYTPDGPA